MIDIERKKIRAKVFFTFSFAIKISVELGMLLSDRFERVHGKKKRREKKKMNRFFIQCLSRFKIK
jgi:hypothetical protein